MSYGEKMILVGMAIGGLSVLVLATPSWLALSSERRELRRRLTSYRKNWKKP